MLDLLFLFSDDRSSNLNPDPFPILAGGAKGQISAPHTGNEGTGRWNQLKSPG